MDAITARTLFLEKEQEKLKMENEKLQVQLRDLKTKIASNRKNQNNILDLNMKDQHIAQQLEKNKLELQAYFDDLVEKSPVLDFQKKNNSEIHKELTADHVKESLSMTDSVERKEMEDIVVKRKPDAFSRSHKFSYGVEPDVHNAQTKHNFDYSQIKINKLLMRIIRI